MTVVQTVRRYLWVTALLLSVVTVAYSMTSEEARLLRKDYQLYQAWSLSRNYFFGTTLPRDRIKALAWQTVYVDLLPAAYPKKDQLLSYREGLNNNQIQQAKEMAKSLISRYNLGLPFNEMELSEAYVLRDENNNWNNLQLDVVPEAAATNFKHWIQWLANHDKRSLAIELDNRGYALLTKKQFPIIYGQIIIKGPESPEMLNSNIDLSNEGYFVAHTNQSQLFFNMPGYKPVTVAINQSQQVQYISPVILEPLSHSKRTGVVGRVLPWSGFDHGNIILRAELPKKQVINDPWMQPVVPITVTNNGEVYTTGLAPGPYQLIINTAGLSTVIRFSAKEGEIRGLSLIDFRKKIAR